MNIKNRLTVSFGFALTLPLLVFYHYPPNGSVFADGLSLVLWVVIAGMLITAGLNGRQVFTDSYSPKLAGARVYDFLVSPDCIRLIIGFAVMCWAIQVRQGQYGFLSVVLTTFGAALAAWATFVLGTRWAQHEQANECAASFALALTCMGVAVACLGWVQYFFADGYWPWINSLETPGRIYGNLRQPNHLALVLAWSIWGAIWYSTHKGVLFRANALVLVFLVPVLAMTGSRMGQALLACFVLLSWLSPYRKLRLKLTLLAVAIYAASWLLISYIAQNGGLAFFGLRGAMWTSTGSRYELWSQVVHVIGQIPWYGCGIGQFNFCWTHAILDERVFGAVFHAHNLVLHGLVEWGWPLTFLLISWITLGIGLFIRYGRQTAAALPAGVFLSSLLHAMLEYPWWYAYLLLPTGFAFGWMWALSYKNYRRGIKDGRENHQSAGFEVKHSGAKLVVLLPGIFLLCSGMLYVQQYLPLRFLFAAGYAKPINVEELRRINSQAALFSMPLSYAIVMKLTENTKIEEAASMIPYLKLAGRGTNDPEFLSRFAFVAALAQENLMAQHLAWRAVQSDPDQLGKLVKKVAQFNSPSLAVFAAYLQKPMAINLDRAVFEK